MEELRIPKKVINSDWKDDIDYEPYDKEKEYISPDKVSSESIEKIKARKINQNRGHMVFNIFKSEKITA